MSLSALCVSCGLCCEGSLFRFMRLGPEEAERLPRLGLEVFSRRDGAPCLRLACAGLSGQRCTLYQERPLGCRAFVCRVGRALESGALGFAQAQEVVAHARALVGEVERALGPAREAEPRSALQRAHARGLPDGPEPLRRAEAWLRTHFLDGEG